MATIIPLSALPSDVFRMELDDKLIRVQTKYNTRAAYWTYDLYINGTIKAYGLALLIGADILKPFNFDIGVQFCLNVEEHNIDANSENLGSSVKLIRISEEELDASNVSGE